MVQDRFDAFAETFDWIHTFKGDIPFWVQQAKRGGGRLLEIGCGTGRTTWEIADAGFPVVGLDISQAMLEMAESKRPFHPDAATVILKYADMRNFKLGIKFPVIIMPGRTFEYALTKDEQIQTLECCIEHLNNSGYIVIFVLGPPTKNLTERKEQFKKNVRNLNSGNVCRYFVRKSYDWPKQITVVWQRLEEIAPDGDILREWRIDPLQFRWSKVEELEKLGQELDLKVVARFSDWLRRPYMEGDNCLIYIYQK